MLLLYIYVAGNNSAYLGLYVRYPIFLSSFNQIWSYWTDVHESPQYKISRKSIQWEPRWHVRTLLYDDINKHFSQLRERASKSYKISLFQYLQHKLRRNLNVILILFPSLWSVLIRTNHISLSNHTSYHILMFSTVHHSIDLFHLPTLMHKSFIH